MLCRQMKVPERLRIKLKLKIQRLLVRGDQESTFKLTTKLRQSNLDNQCRLYSQKIRPNNKSHHWYKNRSQKKKSRWKIAR